MCLNSFDTLNRADKFEPTFNVNVDVNVNVNVNDNGNGHGNDNSHRPTFPSSTIPVLSSLSLDSIQNSGQWPHTSNYQHDTNLLTSNTKDAKDIKAIDSLLLSDAQC